MLNHQQQLPSETEGLTQKAERQRTMKKSKAKAKCAAKAAEETPLAPEYVTDQEHQFHEANCESMDTIKAQLSGVDLQVLARYNLLRLLREGNWEATQYVLSMGIK